MLRNQLALEVKEQHKAALWALCSRRWPPSARVLKLCNQPAVRKVLSDNLLLAMGTMLEEAKPIHSAESISHQGYRRLLSRAREYVLENMSEPLTVLDLCNQLHVSRRTLQMRFTPFWALAPMRG